MQGHDGVSEKLSEGQSTKQGKVSAILTKVQATSMHISVLQY